MEKAARDLDFMEAAPSCRDEMFRLQKSLVRWKNNFAPFIK